MNVKGKENMVGVLLKRIILMHEKSHGNHDTKAYTTTLDYNIQSTTQGIVQALYTDEHLHRLMGSDSCSPN